MDIKYFFDMKSLFFAKIITRNGGVVFNRHYIGNGQYEYREVEAD